MIKKLYLGVAALLSAVIVFNLFHLHRLIHTVSIEALPVLVPQFPWRHSSPPSPQVTTVHLRAVGDVMMGRSVAIQSQKKGDWRWPFLATVPQLSPVDLFIGNLEFPLVDNCPFRDDGMVFCAPPAAVTGLNYAGFQLLSLANNHSGNYGPAGINRTVEVLTQHHITPLLDSGSTVLTVDGVPLGFLALNDLNERLDASRTAALVNQLKSKSAAVIVLIHWGNEYQPVASARQQSLAHTLLTAGAQVIIGSHPHVIQPVASGSSTLVAYSLGNFVFDQMWSAPTRQGLILDLDLSFTHHQLTAIKPSTRSVTIYDYGQPRFDR